MQEAGKPSVNRTAQQDLAPLMTGQMVALYKQSHEMAYRDEYIRRLVHIGFADTEAECLFMYELMILKSNHVAMLCNNGFLKAQMLPLTKRVLTEDTSFYVKHQMFLCSEVTKLFDEAEWHYHNSHEREMPQEVWHEIFSLTRYGGGELFMETLLSMAEHAHIAIEKIQNYAMAEQELLFKYKWKQSEKHPYGP